jgi:hypothetical protein
MSLDIQKFSSIPYDVDSVQVTLENMEEVAKWCQGTVEKIDKPEGEDEFFIRVRVHRPMNERQTKAFPGDHVLYRADSRGGFKVYTEAAFPKSFKPKEG